MSKLIRKPVELPSDTKWVLKDGILEVSGKNGVLSTKFDEKILINQSEKFLYLSLEDENLSSDKHYKSILGTSVIILKNLISGVSKPFEKKLILNGVGYRAQVSGNKLSLSLGFSHPIEYEIPKDVEIVCTTQTEVVVKSKDKELLGMVAAKIKSFRSVEPYQGKGIRYEGEVVFRKETKKKK